MLGSSWTHILWIWVQVGFIRCPDGIQARASSTAMGVRPVVSGVKMWDLSMPLTQYLLLDMYCKP